MNDIILGALAQETHQRYQQEGVQARLVAQAKTLSRTGIATGRHRRLAQRLILIGSRF